MRYDLHFRDLLMQTLVGSTAENSPCHMLTLRESVDPDRLQKAVEAALTAFPLMRSTLVYNPTIAFETIEDPLPLYPGKPEDRPTAIFANGNRYLWRVTYDDRVLCFDNAHSLTDGRGFISFICAIVDAYFGLPLPAFPKEDQSLESAIRPGTAGLFKRKQPKGFRRKSIAYEKNGDNEARCHLLQGNMQQVLSAVHKIDATPATIFAPLFSRTLRKFLNPGTQNRNVSCLMPVDARGILGFDTLHNGITEAYFTYTDRFDTIDISRLTTMYRGMLDLQAQPESVMEAVEKQMKKYQPLLFKRNGWFFRRLSHFLGAFSKKHQCNFVVSYVGKVPFAPEAMARVESFYGQSWHQFQDSNLAIIDCNGTLYINLTEDYVQGEEIVQEFLRECQSVGINLSEVSCRKVKHVTLQ